MEAGLLWFCNWSTLGVCAALKLPQIYAQLAARSARGISLPSLLLELAGFLVFLRYQHYYGNPLLTYLEYPILIAQARIITTLMTTNDLTILIRFVIMLALNIWVTATVLHYRKSVTKAE